MMSDSGRIEFEEGSGNVFEDIGFDRPTAARLSHKADLVGVLHRYQQEMGVSQLAFSRLVGIPQPRLSKLFSGKISGMSTDKLIEAIARLGGHVTIRIDAHPPANDAGRVELQVA